MRYNLVREHCKVTVLRSVNDYNKLLGSVQVVFQKGPESSGKMHMIR
jgi:hypothetical protein